MTRKNIWIWLLGGLLISGTAYGQQQSVPLVAENAKIESVAMMGYELFRQYRVFISNKSSNPFVAVSAELPEASTTHVLKVEQRIEPNQDGEIVLILPENIVTDNAPVAYVNPTLLGYFELPGRKQVHATLALGAAAVEKQSALRLNCSYLQGEEERLPVSSGDTIPFFVDPRAPALEEKVVCENRTPYPMIINAKIKESIQKGTSHFFIKAAPTNHRLEAGQTISLSVGYQHQKTEKVKNTLSIEVTPAFANELAPHTIEIVWAADYTETKEEEALSERGVVVYWRDMPYVGAEHCPFPEKVSVSGHEILIDFGVLFEQHRPTRDCRAEVLIPKMPEATVEQDFKKDSNITHPSILSGGYEIRYISFLTNDLRFRPYKPFSKEGVIQEQASITFVSPAKKGAVPHRETYTITTRVALKKETNLGETNLGRVRPGAVFSLPLQFKGTPLGEFIKNKQFAFKQTSSDGTASFEMFPKDQKSIPAQWNGLISMQFLPTAPYRDGGNVSESLYLYIGDPKNPEQILLWKFTGKVDTAIDLPAVHLGEVPSETANAFRLSFPDVPPLLNFSKVSVSERTPAIPWLSVVRNHGERYNGVMPTPALEYRWSLVKGIKRGDLLSAYVVMDGQTVNLEPIRYRWHVIAQASPKTNFSLEATMGHTGIGERDNITQYQWLNRVSGLYHINGKKYLIPGTYVEIPVGAFLEGSYLSYSQTPVFGLGGRLGVLLYPGKQRFWQVGLHGYLGYRYGSAQNAESIPIDQVPRTHPQDAGRYLGANGVSFGMEAQAQFNLSDKLPSGGGWFVHAGLRVGGLYQAGVEGTASDIGVILGAGYRFGFGRQDQASKDQTLPN